MHKGDVHTRASQAERMTWGGEAARAVLSAQIVVAILGCYAGVFGLVKLKGALSGKKPVPVAAAAAAPSTTSGSTSKWGFEPPTIETFDTWEQNADNWKKWEAFMSNDKLVDQWAATL